MRLGYGKGREPEESEKRTRRAQVLRPNPEIHLVIGIFQSEVNRNGRWRCALIHSRPKLGAADEEL